MILSTFTFVNLVIVGFGTRQKESIRNHLLDLREIATLERRNCNKENVINHNVQTTFNAMLKITVVSKMRAAVIMKNE